jgi:hypothetical protein
MKSNHKAGFQCAWCNTTGCNENYFYEVEGNIIYCVRCGPWGTEFVALMESELHILTVQIMVCQAEAKGEEKKELSDLLDKLVCALEKLRDREPS